MEDAVRGLEIETFKVAAQKTAYERELNDSRAAAAAADNEVRVGARREPRRQRPRGSFETAREAAAAREERLQQNVAELEEGGVRARAEIEQLLTAMTAQADEIMKERRETEKAAGGAGEGRKRNGGAGEQGGVSRAVEDKKCKVTTLNREGTGGKGP